MLLDGAACQIGDLSVLLRDEVMCTFPIVARCVQTRAAHAVSRARCAACVGGGGWVQHGTTVRYSELADPHCLHVSFNPDIWSHFATNYCVHPVVRTA
jgi:hypothetical protein